MVIEEGVDEFAVGHLLLIEHHVGVVGGSKLDEDIPGLGESGAAEGSPVNGVDSVEVVALDVFEGVAVGIAFEAAKSIDIHVFGAAENAVVRDIF